VPASEDDNYRLLRELSRREGAALFGVADVSPMRESFNELAPGAIDGLDRAVCVAYHLSDPVLEDLMDRPTHLYYFHYRRVNLLLDDLTLKLTAAIQQTGHRALPIPASQVIDWDNQLAHVSHKHVAVEAGLGWIGRNNLLVTPEYGARVRLGTVLTDMPLFPDSPLEDDCRDCRACIEVCPAGAIAEKQQDFDHVGCYEKIRQMIKEVNIGQNVCGVCVKACRGKA
jgi:epoxyqueuosine reductase QueG